MNKKQKIIFGCISLVIVFSMIANTSAVIVGDSEVGVEAGDYIRWDISVTGIGTAPLYINVTAVGSAGGNLVVIGLYDYGGTTSTISTLLEWNATTGHYSPGLQSTFVLFGGLPIIPKLNLTVVANYLQAGGMTSVLVNGNRITANYIGNNYTMDYNSEGLLTRGISATSGVTVYSIKLASGGSVSFGYAFFFIIPVAIIGVLAIKRKCFNLK